MDDLRATIKLPPRRSYAELLRDKQARKRATLGGGEPLLDDEFEPYSLAIPKDHTISPHRSTQAGGDVPSPPLNATRLHHAARVHPARVVGRAPTAAAFHQSAQQAATLEHVTRIANTSASSARALVRAKRQAGLGAKSSRLPTARAPPQPPPPQPPPPPPPSAPSAALVAPASAPEPTGQGGVASHSRALGAPVSEARRAPANHPTLARPRPCQACRAAAAGDEPSSVELKKRTASLEHQLCAKEQALRSKEEEASSLLHELSRSDRQWRDMVALLEGQLGEARSRCACNRPHFAPHRTTHPTAPQLTPGTRHPVREAVGAPQLASAARCSQGAAARGARQAQRGTRVGSAARRGVDRRRWRGLGGGSGVCERAWRGRIVRGPRRRLCVRWQPSRRVRGHGGPASAGAVGSLCWSGNQKRDASAHDVPLGHVGDAAEPSRCRAGGLPASTWVAAVCTTPVAAAAASRDHHAAAQPAGRGIREPCRQPDGRPSDGGE